MTYKEAVKEVYRWQYTDRDIGPSFFWYLITAIRKADADNKWQIALGFPQLVRAVDDWQNYDGDQDDFFGEHLQIEDLRAYHRGRWFQKI